MVNPFEEIQSKLTAIESLLQELKQTTSPPKSDEWYDIIGLCQYLPNRPAKPTIYEWVRKRIIPHHKNGKALLFLKSEIDDWLRAGKNKTANSIKIEAENFNRRRLLK